MFTRDIFERDDVRALVDHQTLNSLDDIRKVVVVDVLVRFSRRVQRRIGAARQRDMRDVASKGLVPVLEPPAHTGSVRD